jgi:diguanylate cyclase (GGDEF)-like protein
MVYSFIQGRYIDGVLVTFLICIAALNSLGIQRNNRQVVAYWFFFVIKLITLSYAIYSLGSKVLFWSYPLAFIVFFVQPRLPARVMSLVTAVVLIALSLYLFEMELVSRFALTLLMMIMFCDVLVGVLMELESKLSDLAIRDPLTDAYNRRHMNTLLETTIEETRRNFGPACLIELDVDYFKKINDKYGHHAGDTVLKNLVDLLHNRKRKLDYVFRTGGEEFVLLLRNTSMRQAIMFAESLRMSVEEAHLINGETITISIGVAEYQSDETDDEWLQRADENLYAAKYKGRNCVWPDNASLFND